MGAVAIGPLMLSTQHFAAVIGALAFIVVALLMATKVDDRFHSWASLVIVIFPLGSRIGHIIQYPTDFIQEPIRILSVWQGGFSWIGGLIATSAATLLYLRNTRLLAWSSLPIGAAAAGVGIILLVSAQSNMNIPLPTTSFQTTDGRAIVLGAKLTRPLVLNLWATWCPPCRRELPMMAEFAHGQSSVDFIFANQGDDQSTITTFLNRQNISLDTVVVDADGQLARHYRIRGLPTTLFIGRDGTIQSVEAGELSKETLTGEVSSLR